MTTPAPDRVIEVIVSPAGRTRVTARGYVGPSCKDATRELEQALGVVESDRPTPEMHATQTIPEREGERA